MTQRQKYDVAAYIWPSYHYEPRMEHFWPEKDGEWYTVRRATSRFPGHVMPRIPLLGYQDEADPAVMRQHVKLAGDHGINTFVVDWYWYGGEPCFERQLNDGLIPALQGTDSKFYLMWANHQVDDLWNMHVDTKAKPVLYTGRVTRAEFEPMFNRIIEKYFRLDSYYRIDNKPVFSIFLIGAFVRGLGSPEAATDACQWMRRRMIESGFAGLHLQGITCGDHFSCGEPLTRLPIETAIEATGLDSATAYQFCMDGKSTGEYPAWADEAMSKIDRNEKRFGTFFPHVSIGWDNTHRNPSAGIEEVVTGSNPQAFEICLRRAKAYIDAHPKQAPLITINSWNEWTEGSYLLPDKEFGYGYLEAVRRVFSD